MSRYLDGCPGASARPELREGGEGVSLELIQDGVDGEFTLGDGQDEAVAGGTLHGQGGLPGPPLPGRHHAAQPQLLHHVLALVLPLPLPHARSTCMSCATPTLASNLQLSTEQVECAILLSTSSVFIARSCCCCTVGSGRQYIQAELTHLEDIGFGALCKAQLINMHVRAECHKAHLQRQRTSTEKPTSP